MSDLLSLYCLFFFSTVAAYMANKVVYKNVKNDKNTTRINNVCER